MKTLTAIFAFIVTCQAASHERLIFDDWRAFKTTYNKSYSNLLEDTYRRGIFFINQQKIALKNIEFANGIISYSQSVNRFADLLNSEYTYIVNGFNRTARLNPDTAGNRALPQNIRSPTYIRPLNVNLPDSVDWRENGGVTAVKYQGLCASCYAFSAAGAIEGQIFRKTGELVELSAQSLMDCTYPYGNSGCNGGLMDGAYEYVRDNDGIGTEAGYPYEAQDGVCIYQPHEKGTAIIDYTQIAEGDEEGMKLVLATLGPVSVAIDAGQDAFQFYSDGVYHDVNCESAVDKMNHAVLIVGYGTESNGQDYWLVKNSHGTDWGQGGYIKMARNANNHCGIATSATYPLV